MKVAPRSLKRNTPSGRNQLNIQVTGRDRVSNGLNVAYPRLRRIRPRASACVRVRPRASSLLIFQPVIDSIQRQFQR